MTEEIREKCASVVRVHAAGDFYSPEYAAAWREIARNCRRTKFFAYTRSWTDRAIRRELYRLAQEPNWFLYFSTDRSMPKPPRKGRIRTAYLAENDGDLPRYSVDLVFRDKPKTILKKAGRHHCQVCPVEQHVTRQVPMTCSHCRICYT